YLPNSELGFAQDHFYQHLKSKGVRLSMDHTSRLWKDGTRYFNLFVKHGSLVTSTGQNAGLSVAVNSNAFIRNTCVYQSLVFNVFDPVTFQPMKNAMVDATHAMYGSAVITCNVGSLYNFEYRWDSASIRKRALDFMNNNIPDGTYVVVMSFLLDPGAFPAYAGMIRYADDWKADEAINGPGQTLYHALKNAGFS